MRLASLLAFVLLGCGGHPASRPAAPTDPVAPTSILASPAEFDTSPPSPRDRHPCDPMSSREPAPPLAPTGAVCGNGIVEELAGTCERVCAGGCDTPILCAIECTRPRETCDGRAVDESCVSQGFAGGTMACSPACQLDDRGCVACVPGPGVRCGAAGFPADEVFAVAGGKAAAVFARDTAVGRLTGARVDSKLTVRRFARLPTATLAAGALDGRLGFVDADHRFGVIDAATGRARMLGPVGEDSTPILILRESEGRGGAAVLTGDYQRRTLAIFDEAAPPAVAVPRHFAIDNLRIVVVPGGHELADAAGTHGADLVVIAFGNEVFAYQRSGLELTRLPAAPTGIALAFTYPRYRDLVTWSSGRLEIAARTSPDASAPPAGLSRAALSGSSAARAFGGVLLAGGVHRERTVELYWTAADLIAADPAP